ncbi:hypothetical protein RHSIM_Rhsim03G0075100 [Rhododendron simsii]|uniref:Glucosamine 6-phosphate N-acetyltransferase n=1 Tax=Rhododendron simsii TaxID=118357 RepID=A0A834H6I7_RHOSS|nr:hypothetical protein RHSIM_Rhsim03G0075100 [Rhododendron simsii]
MQSKESSLNEEESFPVRKLEISDKRKGFIELLQQLTVCDSVSDKEFEGRFQELSLYGDDHLVCVIEDNCSGKIVATGSVFIEKKFIRNCGKVGHIEDVVVDSNARGMQLGKKIIAFLSDHAQSMGCYKVILDCSADNKVFYEKCGFKQKEIQMVKASPTESLIPQPRLLPEQNLQIRLPAVSRHTSPWQARLNSFTLDLVVVAAVGPSLGVVGVVGEGIRTVAVVGCRSGRRRSQLPEKELEPPGAALTSVCRCQQTTVEAVLSLDIR